MPVADSLMKAGNNLLNFLNISKNAPQILSQERSELNSLIGVITGLNEKNDFRKTLLQQLNVKYPDLFKNIDIETINLILGKPIGRVLQKPKTERGSCRTFL